MSETSQQSPRIQTQRLFHVFAAKRSGQHAVMWWMRCQLRPKTERINNCPIPYDALRRPPEWARSDSGTVLRALFLNYEDKEPSLLREVEQRGSLFAAGIEAAQISYLLILRDPFNNLASKRQINPQHDLAVVRREAAMWKALAKEFLGETNFLPDKYAINYNQWFSSAEYREALSAKLGLDYSPNSAAALLALQDVPRVGHSTFDGRAFHGRAQDMDVLNRWRRHLDDHVYLEALRDPELCRLHNRIFAEYDMSELYERLAI